MGSYGDDDFRAKHPLGCEALGVTTPQAGAAESREGAGGEGRGGRETETRGEERERWRGLLC